MDRRTSLPHSLETHLGSILISILLTLIYGPVLYHWFDGWLNKSISIDHEYFSHGLIGLPYAAYLAYGNYRKWQTLPDRFHPLGAFFIALALILYLSGTLYGVNLSFPLVLLGLCLAFKGIPGLKLNGFPLLLVFLATPNPLPYLMTPYTLPLQTFIAGVAGFILTQLGFKVSVDQFYLMINGRAVEVAPYCAGLKMLFTSLYVTLILLQWTGNLNSRKRTIFMLITAVVISVSANVLRNTLLAWLHGIGNNQGFDWLHEGWGGDVYSMAMLLIIVWINQRLDYLGFSPPQTSQDKQETESL